MCSTAPIIYNLFPRLVGDIKNWPIHTKRAQKMGFDWVFVNSFNYPGFSGSLYAVKDYYRLNPLFVSDTEPTPIKALSKTIEKIHKQGLKVMMDLVINHTSKDSPLIKEHPTWFRRDNKGYVISPSAIDPADARKVTVWGDLAEIDNANSEHRQELWAYWTALVQFYLDLGFDGFRCDAAYKVPTALWDQLIRAAHKRLPEVIFAAETLGCRLAEMRNLCNSGFDFLFNSSKWWNFDETWCLDQHEEFKSIAPSISFPESHDTNRLFKESNGLVQVQKQRYAFAAAFSAGLLMPIGYEYCFSKQLNTVTTIPDDWEKNSDSLYDLSDFVSLVNELKKKNPVLSTEGSWKVVTNLNGPTIILEKRSPAQKEPVLLLVNKDWEKNQPIQLVDLTTYLTKAPKLWRICTDSKKPDNLPSNRRLTLNPAEIIYVLTE